MTGYIIFGGLRNLFGIALLTVLTWFGLPVSPALLIVVSIGFVLYTLQVRLFVGEVYILTTAGVFVVIFFANRILLWVIYERLGTPIFFAQFVSIVLLTGGSYLFLKSGRRDRRR